MTSDDDEEDDDDNNDRNGRREIVMQGGRLGRSIPQRYGDRARREAARYRRR